jgi:regulator of replication initiation timing
MKKKIKNQKRYAQNIRASFQKFLGLFEHNTVLGMEKEKMRKQMVKRAKEVVNTSDKKIINDFPGNEKNQSSLRLVRLFNKEKEIDKEGNRIKKQFKKFLKT